MEDLARRCGPLFGGSTRESVLDWQDAAEVARITVLMQQAVNGTLPLEAIDDILPKTVVRNTETGSVFSIMAATSPLAGGVEGSYVSHMPSLPWFRKFGGDDCYEYVFIACDEDEDGEAATSPLAGGVEGSYVSHMPSLPWFRKFGGDDCYEYVFIACDEDEDGEYLATLLAGGVEGSYVSHMPSLPWFRKFGGDDCYEYVFIACDEDEDGEYLATLLLSFESEITTADFLAVLRCFFDENAVRDMLRTARGDVDLDGEYLATLLLSFESEITTADFLAVLRCFFDENAVRDMLRTARGDVDLLDLPSIDDGAIGLLAKPGALSIGTESLEATDLEHIQKLIHAIISLHLQGVTLDVFR